MKNNFAHAADGITKIITRDDMALAIGAGSGDITNGYSFPEIIVKI